MVPARACARGSAIKALHGLCALTFALSAVVQLNDPDPLRWFLIYALAAACSGAALFGRRPRLAARLIALWALAWALLWIPHLEPASASELFGSPKMLRPGVEFDREFGGLLLVFFGMLPVALAPKSKD